MISSVKEAVILAGGLGTRLRSEVDGVPKCLAPVNGKPFLHYVITYCLSQNLKRLIFSVGYKADQIMDYLKKEWPQHDFMCCFEDEPLGTGGAIRKSLSITTDNLVSVLNGDTLYRADLQKMAAFHEIHQSECTLALKPMQNFNRYGVVELDNDGRIVSFREKMFYKEGYINGGIYMLQKNKFLIENLPEKFSFEKDYLERLTASRKFYGIIDTGYFIDIGIPEDYHRAGQELSKD
jgi:D-glycero-alpha-D-manno-heptose 1-phosphate guanylyltransferase